MNIQPCQSRPAGFDIPRPAAAAGPQPEEGAPDLVVTDLLPDRREPRQGERVHFDVKVANQGTADAAEFALRLEGDGLRQQVTIPGLAAGEQVVVRMGPRVADHRELYTVRADVDATGRVPESREDNNYLIAFLPGPKRPPFPPPTPPMPPPFPGRP